MLNRRIKASTWRRENGLTLIEVLVAALVLAVGLVGLAGLHLNSLQATHSSYYRSVATMIALDAEERAWLRLAESGDLEAGDLPAIVTAVVADWNQACPDDCVLLPNLDVDLSVAATGTTWIDIEIEVSWAEGRFVDVDRETFAFRTRIPRG